jgi:hypothetical protein
MNGFDVNNNTVVTKNELLGVIIFGKKNFSLLCLSDRK